ncbi:MAG TPA: hypothetical protein VJ742_13340 [Nitrososphaera sp.]|nr:hypothetical protein [Nitrososphaera sp.]
MVLQLKHQKLLKLNTPLFPKSEQEKNARRKNHSITRTYAQNILITQVCGLPGKTVLLAGMSTNAYSMVVLLPLKEENSIEKECNGRLSL